MHSYGNFLFLNNFLTTVYIHFPFSKISYDFHFHYLLFRIRLCNTKTILNIFLTKYALFPFLGYYLYNFNYLYKKSPAGAILQNLQTTQTNLAPLHLRWPPYFKSIFSFAYRKNLPSFSYVFLLYAIKVKNEAPPFELS